MSFDEDFLAAMQASCSTYCYLASNSFLFYGLILRILCNLIGSTCFHCVHVRNTCGLKVFRLLLEKASFQEPQNRSKGLNLGFFESLAFLICILV